jgi:hypothetical protein
MRGYGLGDPTLDDGGYLKKDFFTYETFLPEGSTLTAGNSTTSTFNVDGDSDFFWLKFAQYVAESNGVIAVPGVDIIITDTTSGRDLMNGQVPLSSIAGTGQLPFILPVERFMSAKSTIKVQYFNVGGEDITRMRLSFIGIKAFKAN